MRKNTLTHAAKSVLSWFDASQHTALAADKQVDWLRLMPFIALHLACLAVFWVGVSAAAVIAMLFFYFIRMFAITGFYHRYFSHKAFKTNRFWQFIFALIGAAAVQRGPLWWAAHHRKHHLKADTSEDVHSPMQNGFFYSHIGWFMTAKNFSTDYNRVTDLAAFPELVFLNRFDILVPVLFAVFVFFMGEALAHYAPQLHTNGWQMLVWGFCVSTVLLYHATFSINSLAHLIGTRSYDTSDDSRNNFFLALITLGEGWHNNHHYSPGAARHGFKWWQIDITYYLLVLLAKMKIIRQLKSRHK